MSKKKVEKKDVKKDAQEVKKTEKTKKTRAKKLGSFDFKTWGLVAVAVVAFLIVITLIVQFNRTEKIESSYFHDSDGKIVLTMDKEMAALDESEYEPYITHVIYYYENGKITSVRAYYEYPDESAAKEAYDNLALGEFADSKNLNGRFVVFQVKRAQYDGVSLEEVQASVEALKEINALILDYEDGYIDKYVEAKIEIDEDPVEGATEGDGESGSDDSSAGESADNQ